MTARDTRTGSEERFRTRREVLATVGGAGGIALAGCIGNGPGDDGTTTETEEPGVQVGAAIPRSGIYGNEGDELQAGYLLAIQHINDGGGAIDTSPFEALSGGVVGENIQLVREDTESSADGARQAAETLVSENDVDVLIGGASHEEALAIQSVAAEEELVYMAGFTPTSALGGESCSQYSFNEIHNPAMMANALRKPVAGSLGPDNAVSFAQMHPDNDIGSQYADAFARFADIGDDWFHQDRANVATRVGAQSYTGAVETLKSAGPDMIILNYYGLDAADVLREAVNQFDPSVDIVVPLMDRVFARNAGSAMADVLGTTHWHPSVGGSFSETFVDSWSDIASENSDLGLTPSGTAHVAYVQLAQWAAAAERAGSIQSDAVISELEDRSYDVGLGTATLRACDHQAQRGVPVVRGVGESQQSPGDFFELEEVASNVGYGCDEDVAAGCSL